MLDFINLQVSALRALRAYGLAEHTAKALVAEAKMTGSSDITFVVPASARNEVGWTLLLRKMRGGHVEVYRVVGGTTTLSSV